MALLIFISLLKGFSVTNMNLWKAFVPRLWILAICGLGLFASTPVDAEDRGIADFPALSPKTDWPWWRGPSRNGYAQPDAQPPTEFSASNHVKWKAQVPGRGHGSPIVVGSKVFLPTADEAAQIHSVIAFDRNTGKKLWETEVNRGAFPENNHPKNTEASPTIACDGERLFISFYHHDQVELIALTLDGKVSWRRFAGRFKPMRFEYGYAPSPLLYQNSVIVSAEWEGESFIAALDRQTGKPLWKTPRAGMLTFSSPVIANVAGKDQLLISGQEKVSAYNPTTGKLLWSTPGTTMATCGTMVWEGDVVVASGGYPKAETIAVKADGSGKVLWKNNQKCYEQSMILIDGYVYALTDNGVMFCWNAQTGKEMWKQRLTGPVSASPVYAGGNIYWANELGTMYVFKPNPQKYEEVARNTLGNSTFASPAVVGKELFLRVGEEAGGSRQEWLYCLE